MAAEEFAAESQKLFYKTAYKTSPNKGKRIFNSIQLNLFILNNIRNLFKKLYKIHTKLQNINSSVGNEFLQKLKRN